MTDEMLSELDVVTTVEDEDLAYVVIDVGTTPVSKGISFANLKIVFASGAGVDEVLAPMNLLGWF
jgi:phosphoglycerate dehydrogenase-like enzyme